MIRATLAATATAALLLAPQAHADDDLGARLYLNHCAACHGEYGEGDGSVAATLRVTMPNLRSLAMRNDGVFPADAVTAYVDGREATPRTAIDRCRFGATYFAGRSKGPRSARYAGESPRSSSSSRPYSTASGREYWPRRCVQNENHASNN